VIRFVRGLVGIVIVLALWQLGSILGFFPDYALPPPSTVIPRLYELLLFDKPALIGGPTFIQHVVGTLLAWVIGLVIATVIAVPAGLVLGSVPVVRAATRVVVEFLRPIPSVALIPLAIVLIGSGPETKISLAVYAAIWPILFNTIYALDEIDPLQLDTARSFGFGRARTMFTVGLPHAAPFVFTGVRLASAVTMIVVISVEFFAGGRIGVGTFALEAASGAGQMDRVLATTLLVGVIGYLIDGGFDALQRRLFRWNTVEAEAK
jgi:NitT/TauT family transport system permease protein